MKNRVLIKIMTMVTIFSIVLAMGIVTFATDGEIQTIKRYEVEFGKKRNVRMITVIGRAGNTIDLYAENSSLKISKLLEAKSITVGYKCINVVKGKTVDGRLSLYINDIYIQDVIFPYIKGEQISEIKLDIEIPKNATITFTGGSDFSDTKLDYFDLELAEPIKPIAPKKVIGSTPEGIEQAYNHIIKGMEQHQLSIDVSQYDLTQHEAAEIINRFSSYYLPNLFHVDRLNSSAGAFATRIDLKMGTTLEGKPTSYVDRIVPTYKMSAKDYAPIGKKYKTSIAKMLGTVLVDATTVEKIIAVNDYIASITTYSLSAPNKYSARGIFVDGRAVCKGYALAFIDGMNRLGIECKFIVGNNSNHGWVMVKIDDDWYHIDPTWNDTANSHHKYALLSDEAIRNKGHYDWYAMVKPGKSIDAPLATNTQYDDGSWDAASQIVENTESIDDEFLPIETTALEGKIEPKIIVPTGPMVALPSASDVLVNGELIQFEAYNINGNNFFKLRDLAKVISGTSKQFAIGYDNATSAIILTSGMAYTAVGGELSQGDNTEKTARSTASKIYVNGKETPFVAYIIGGNNYFKLRDVTKIFNIGVDYDVVSKAVIINTSVDYITDTVNPQKTRIEGENGVLIGGVKIDNLAIASGGKIVSYLQDIDDSAEYSKVPKSNGITIGYTRGNNGPGKLAMYINDIYTKDIDFENTRSWQLTSSVSVTIDIPEGASVKFVIQSADSAVNIDYIDFYTSK